MTPTFSPPLQRLAAAALVTMFSVAAAGCPADEKPVTSLLLAVTSEPLAEGKRITELRILATDGTTRFPAPGTDLAAASQSVAEGADLTVAPVYVGLEYEGTIFSTPTVQVSVIGLFNGEAVASWTGNVDLTSIGLVEAKMIAMAGDCDVDKDGFADCSIAGCCAGGTELGDCVPNDATANPWGLEPACEPCTNTVDQDCSGGDQKCIDEDQDGVADCAEVEAQCGVGDPTVAPGLAELCDGIDNNCDGQVDEGLTSESGKAVGEACAKLDGACAGGVVVCGADPTAAPACDNPPEPEVCGNAVDEDCDGALDNGCSALDVDGDGFDAGTGPNDDCNDYDAAFNPGPNTQEPCCPLALKSPGEDEFNPTEAVKTACDYNCDGVVSFCLEGDVDGDGVATPSDCDDNDPTVFPGAPEKCDDGVDQDCFGGDLPCSLITDKDGDGYADDKDCNDDSADIFPGAKELCDGVDNDCDGVVDDGNPEGGGSCGSDVGLCSPGISVCGVDAGLAVLRCAGGVEPEAVEQCDDLDHDCDGSPYNGLLLDGSAVGGTCDGVGACGLGSVECSPEGELICNTSPGGSQHEMVPEVCDGLDNDCDGEVDEELTLAESNCLQEGVCATNKDAIGAACVAGEWQCDYSGVAGFEGPTEASCDGIDNDCDGAIDDDFNLGGGCDGDDPDQCDNGTIACAPAGSGEVTICVESGTSDEVCDGLDNDCDGEVDEGFGDLGDACDGNDADACPNGVRVCSLDFSGTVCLEEGPGLVELCNGIDDDCDGEVDEGFGVVGQACDGDDADQCAQGFFECNAAQDGVVCVGDIALDTVEICDGIDNDCDGQVDEGVNPNIGQPCDGDDGDECEDGVWECPANGDLQNLTCSDDPDSILEVCDGEDNDCNGTIDDGIVGSAADGNCSTQGICAGAGDDISATCVVGGTGTWTCNYSGVAGYVEVEVDCNGVDENCNGVADDDFPNQDEDAFADCVDPDIDNDTIPNDDSDLCTGEGVPADCSDNCPLVSNADQANLDGDTLGDACDEDVDGDGVNNDVDNCPVDFNPDQEDGNDDLIGDACTVDVCEANESRCDVDGRTLLTCTPEGDAEVPSTCAFICAEDKCMMPTGEEVASLIGGCNADTASTFSGITWGAAYIRDDEILLCNTEFCTSVPAFQNSTGKDKPVVFCLDSLALGAGKNFYQSGFEPANGPAIFLVNGDVSINGTIDLSGGEGLSVDGGTAGPGGWTGADLPQSVGNGQAGNGPGAGLGGGGGGGSFFDGAGGGGGAFGGNGGDGGDADNGNGGDGGSSYGDDELLTLQGGSGGGSGGDGGGNAYPGPGGGGAGAIQIVSRGTITVSASGQVLLRGGAGRTTVERQGAGGGGAGGAVLFEARVLSLTGSTFDVRGGSGGDAKGTNGGAGGGSGSGVDGADGGSTGQGNQGTGGGGGGAGRVRFNTPSGGQSCDVVQPVAACTSGALTSN